MNKNLKLTETKAFLELLDANRQIGNFFRHSYRFASTPSNTCRSMVACGARVQERAEVYSC